MEKRPTFARVVAAAALLLAAVGAEAAPVAHDQEIQAAAGIFHRQGSDVGTVSGDVSYGYFFTPQLELGLRQTGNYAFIDDARDQWQLGTEPFFDYHFNYDPEQAVVPYLGVFIGAIYNDIDVTGTLGPNAGLKIFMNDQTFLNVAYRYEWFWEEIESGGLTDEFSDGNHVGTIGIGFVFGGDRPERTVAADTTVIQRVEDAAARTEQAADRTTGAAQKLERAADQMDDDFQRGLRK